MERGEKILIKGEPGMDKTTLIKKVAYDWVKGLFTVVSIVFLVFLKLVSPGDSIHDIIIKQNPSLEEFGITSQQLTDMFYTFGNKCLLILDGLDEHALGRSLNVRKPKCN